MVDTLRKNIFVREIGCNNGHSFIGKEGVTKSIIDSLVSEWEEEISVNILLVRVSVDKAEAECCTNPKMFFWDFWRKVITQLEKKQVSIPDDDYVMQMDYEVILKRCKEIQEYNPSNCPEDHGGMKDNLVEIFRLYTQLDMQIIFVAENLQYTSLCFLKEKGGETDADFFNFLYTISQKSDEMFYKTTLLVSEQNLTALVKGYDEAGNKVFDLMSDGSDIEDAYQPIYV